jgi:hypothetical protein
MEDFDQEDEAALKEEAEPLMEAAFAFFDKEMDNLE